MTTTEIELLIAEAKAKHLFLHSPDRPGVYLTPSGTERIGVERLVGSEYPNGWKLISAKEIAERHKEYVI